ncbi:MAG TPA: M20/M25/M40 family metallo-hydrolase [Solirubrobacterales bacterium]|nr:M20/M25/M40 family metallo-hydrolase [Solirubrobacterales bacterium]
MSETVEKGTLGAEAVKLLSEIIRFDTVNPPGNERPAQEHVAKILEDAGFEVELLEKEPDRTNVIARLPGKSEGPVLAYISHMDTVPANPDEWSFSPWSGDVVDGFVQGRGGQDMKDQVATEVAAAAHLARSGWRPERGELKVIVAADEELGAHLGARWLCEEHPEKVYADFVVNEGGGALFEIEGRRFYPVSLGEKGVFRFILRAKGRAGHGSVPSLGDNALLRLAPAISRLVEQPPLEPAPAGIEFLQATTGRDIDLDNPGDLVAALAELRRVAPQAAAYMAEPMLRVTLVPTMIEASAADNVIPAVAEVVVDCRVPPGLGEEHVREQIAGVLGTLDPNIEIEFQDKTVGNDSPYESELAEAIREWLAEVDPEATLVPDVMPGFSDSHWFRKAFGSCVVYGFHPQRELDMLSAAPLVHGADECAAVADVELAADFYAWLAQRILG